ncbi:hypothetical protein F4780DRAFT_778791 [Xylariomycetidae sp. FL0641]|nr:hypothetical protein F4780DRAFT_778791 [Xylariomycetidae sp. FL0641]
MSVSTPSRPAFPSDRAGAASPRTGLQAKNGHLILPYLSPAMEDDMLLEMANEAFVVSEARATVHDTTVNRSAEHTDISSTTNDKAAGESSVDSSAGSRTQAASKADGETQPLLSPTARDEATAEPSSSAVFSYLSESPSEAGAGSRCSSGGFAPPAWTAIRNTEAIQNAAPHHVIQEEEWEDSSDGSCAAESNDALSMSPVEVLPPGLAPVGCWVVTPGFTATSLDFSKRTDYLAQPKKKTSALSEALQKYGKGWLTEL